MAHRLLLVFAALAVAAASAGCSGRPQGPVPTASGARTPGAENMSDARVSGSEYIIGPGDKLNVFVYRAPELSAEELPVRPDGRISLPLVPDVEALGRTPTQLAREVEERLKRYVLDPNVTVMVQSFVGPSRRQVRVIGEATQPMGIPYHEGMTLLDVMISAKGLTRYAAGNRAEIIRRQHEAAPLEVIRVRLSDLLRDGDMSQDVPMRPGDTLVIPQGWF